MRKLEVFFDYHCPYCLKGHDQLIQFIQEQLQLAQEQSAQRQLVREQSEQVQRGLEIIWHPCEIGKLKNFTRTEHTDICAQGLFFALDIANSMRNSPDKIDIWQYHQKVYDLIFKDRANVSDVNVLSKALEGILDVGAFREAIKSGKYNERVNDSNQYAFQETGIHVVPTYRVDGGFLQDRQEFFNMGPSSTSYNQAK